MTPLVMKLAAVMLSLAAFLVPAVASAQGRFHRAPVRHGAEHHARAQEHPRVHQEHRAIRREGHARHPVVVHRPLHRR